MEQYRRVILLIVGIVMAFCVGFQALAQDNPYNIDNGLYARYSELFKFRHDPACLAQSDSLYADALRIGDYKAACLALSVPVYYYFHTPDSVGIYHAVERLKRVSRRHNYLQYYYFAYANLANWHLTYGHSLRALQISQQMQQQAQADNHHYGFYSCLRLQGNIYFTRGNNDLGVKCYRQAYDYQQRFLPEQDPSQILRYLASYYETQKDGEQALYYARKAIDEAKTETSRVTSEMDLCRIYYHTGDTATFLSMYARLEPVIKEMGRDGDDKNLILLTLLHIHRRQWEAAEQCASKLSSPTVRFTYLREVAEVSGDYERAYRYSEQHRDYIDSINNYVSGTDLAELTAQLSNESMQRQAKELELQNTALQLANTRLELEQARNQAEMEKAQADNNLLSLRNSELEREQLNIEIERQDSLQREQASRARARIYLLGISLLFLLALSVVMMVYLYKRRRIVGALQASNQQLIVARDKAMESDRMKSLFIQNISHEIRTPLNAIVGFSQLLTDDEVELDADDKQEYCSQISYNSDMLLMLVNDVLDLATLESGRYTMHPAPCQCNSICHNALASVQHRCPEGVELRFTSEVDDDYELNTDAQRVQQVLINYLTNAEKNTEAGGVIHLHCSLDRGQGKITFEVTNTGQRIPREQASAIFERFYKLDAHKQGTGLGLSICRLIAERLGGQVMCDSSYSDGARFLFTLPVSSTSLKERAR